MRTAERVAEIQARAEAGAERPAGYGPDIDLSVLGDAAERDRVKSLESLERQVQEVALGVGVDTSRKGRAGSYFQMDRVILEAGAEAHVITGCTIHPRVDTGLHAGISEFYIGEGARLTFTMIHNWAEGFEVRPRTAVLVEADGVFVNNYILLRPVRSIQTYPSCRLKGARSRAVFTSITYGLGDSYLDIGAEVVLEGEGTRAESVARAAARDRAVVYSGGRLIGKHDDAKAHLDCRGIVFSKEARMVAIPELVCHGAPRAELSHEAAISPIAAEEIYYLMTRGVPRDQAISMITRGFLDLDIPGLPPALRRSIDAALEETARESL